MNAKRILTATLSAFALAAGLGLPATASADRDWREQRHERHDGWGHRDHHRGHWKHHHHAVGPRYYAPPPVVYYAPPPPPPVVVYPGASYPWSGWDARIVFRGGSNW